MTLYTKICLLCGNQFETNSKIKKYCDSIHRRKCKVCGKEFAIDLHYVKQQTCSKECARSLRKQNAENTSLEKYGVKNAGYTKQSQEKIRNTCREKYGVDYPGQSYVSKQHVKEAFIRKYNGIDNPMKIDEVKAKAQETCLKKYGVRNPLSKGSPVWEKVNETNMRKYGTLDPGNSEQGNARRRQTCLERFGVDYASQADSVRKKREATCLERYGAKSPLESSAIQAKIQKTCLDKYGYENSFKSQEIHKKIQETMRSKYGVDYACQLPQCKQASGTTVSSFNRQLSNKLSNMNITNELEFNVERFSYDIHITNSDILIEIDPTWTHSTCDIPKFGSVKYDYHLKKSEVAQKHGYRCIHVFDWDNIDKIVNLLTSKSIVYARQLKICDVSTQECDNFLNMYHLQGTCKGQKIRIGLKTNDELVGLITFGQPRYNSNFEYELLRLCYKPDRIVIGGSEKLFKSFINSEINPSSIVSYCDNSKFTGCVYQKLGFKLCDKGQPSKHWSKGSKHVTDNLLRQRGYDQLFGSNYGKGTSNEQLMLENGWLPIYDCGQSRYEWRRALNA